MSIDNHAAGLGEAISAISAISAGQKNHYLREIKVVFARVYPFFQSFSAFSVMKIVYGNNKIYT